MSKRLAKKNAKLKLKKFQEKMIASANLGLDNFIFNSKTYILSSSGNLAQTLIDDRILYRIYTNKKPKMKKIKSGCLYLFI